MADVRKGRLIGGRWVDWADLTPAQRAGGNGGSTQFLPPSLRDNGAEKAKPLIPRTVQAGVIAVAMLFGAWRLKRLAEEGFEGPSGLVAVGGTIVAGLLVAAVSDAVEDL